MLLLIKEEGRLIDENYDEVQMLTFLNCLLKKSIEHFLSKKNTNRIKQNNAYAYAIEILKIRNEYYFPFCCSDFEFDLKMYLHTDLTLNSLSPS